MTIEISKLCISIGVMHRVKPYGSLLAHCDSAAHGTETMSTPDIIWNRARTWLLHVRKIVLFCSWAGICAVVVAFVCLLDLKKTFWVHRNNIPLATISSFNHPCHRRISIRQSQLCRTRNAWCRIRSRSKVGEPKLSSFRVIQPAAIYLTIQTAFRLRVTFALDLDPCISCQLL